MTDIRIDRGAVEGYARGADDVVADLAMQGGRLEDVLGDLRAAPETFLYLGDCPPLEYDLQTRASRLGLVAAAAREIVARMIAVDENGLGTVDASTLDGILADVRAADEARVYVDEQGRLVVDGTTGSDHIQVIDNGDGTLTIRIGRVEGRPPSERLVYDEQVVDATDTVVIRGGDGDDVIEVPESATVSLIVSGGDGDDIVGAGRDGATPLSGGGGDDLIFGGDGDDVIVAGAGDDAVFGGDGSDSLHGQDGADLIVGGGDYDVAYGGRGDDTLYGGDGNDSLEGGSGNDALHGQGGDDLLSGGDGDDVITGGIGSDRIFAGEGTDLVDGGAGVDRATVEAGDTTTGTMRIEIEIDGELGSYAIEFGDRPANMSQEAWDAWMERVESDLDLIRQTGAGMVGLGALDDASRASDSGWNPFDSDRHIIVRPYASPSGPDDFDVLGHLTGGNALAGSVAYPNGSGDAAGVGYNTYGVSALDDRPPVNSLYHELSHSFDQISGGTNGGDYTETIVDSAGNVVATGTAPMAEINSVGRDIDGDGDIDTQDSAGGREHPVELTENSLREDLGIPARPSYIFRPGNIPADAHIEITDVSPEPRDD